MCAEEKLVSACWSTDTFETHIAHSLYCPLLACFQDEKIGPSPFVHAVQGKGLKERQPADKFRISDSAKSNMADEHGVGNDEIHWGGFETGGE